MRGQFYTDTMDGRCKSLDGNKFAQVFANKDFFAVAYPMSSKSYAGEGLRQFVHDYGRPESLTFDGSREQCGSKTEFMKNIRKYSINYHITEPERPNHNFAEGVPGNTKEMVSYYGQKEGSKTLVGLRSQMGV